MLIHNQFNTTLISNIEESVRFPNGEKLSIKYSDQIATLLEQENYTHCFFVAGGNIMHLIESLSHKMEMVPVVNEISTVIAAEYFNEYHRESGKKAFALVTAGPGITNCITGIAGAYLESRELLVIGGQVKSSDLSRKSVRQNGIQEINGVDLVNPVAIRSVLMDKPVSKHEFISIIRQGKYTRKGPVFIEICLDVQASNVEESEEMPINEAETPISMSEYQELELLNLLIRSNRPALLVGSGVNLEQIPAIAELSAALNLPIFSTWNGADRFAYDTPNYVGRPNNWGQRHANIALQQCDLLIAAGTRLGFQQTGFNVDEFCVGAKIVQIELDQNEIDKGHPKIELGIVADAGISVVNLLQSANALELNWESWLKFCSELKELIPVPDPSNFANPNYVELFTFLHELSDFFGPKDVLIPSSSGGGSTATMQVVKQKGLPQRIITNKGMASMGYGLSGAIGAAIASGEITWLIDGDGGFIQNIQELSVIKQFELPVKIFIISNNGYASIRSTQRNYFNGHYIGCDSATGLYIPKFNKICEAYEIEYHLLDAHDPFSDSLKEVIKSRQPALIEIPVDPEQSFYPKITSRVSKTKGMESNPLHKMTPDLDLDTFERATPYLTS